MRKAGTVSGLGAGEVSACCGVDIGTQGVRAVVVSLTGRVLGAGDSPISRDHRDGPVHEQLPEDWWQALVVAVRAAVDQATAAVGAGLDVRAVALDATSGTVLVEGADGSARGPALMYDDTRAAAQCERAQAAGAELWQSLGYRMQPAWALPKVLWLQDAGALGHGDRVVHQADHLVRRLVGAPVATDTSHALKTGVDLESAAWPGEVFADLGVPLGLLPPVVLPGTVLGTVSAAAAQHTGLPAHTVVRAGMTDGCAAQIAARALRPGSWSSALGTTLVVKGSTGQLLHDPSGAVYCHRNPDGGWLPGGASSTGAGVLRDTFPGADAAALAGLTRRAAALVPLTAVVYPLGGAGERFPFVAPAAHAFGLDTVGPETGGPDTGGPGTGGPETGGPDAARFGALCQGIAYVEKLAYDVLGDLGADVSGPVSLTGGAARNRWWSQLRADVLGRPALLPASAEAAVGMAVLAAAEPGALAETAEAMVPIADTLTPDPARGAALLPGYHRLVEALADRGWLEHGLAGRVLALRAGSGVVSAVGAVGAVGAADAAGAAAGVGR